MSGNIKYDKWINDDNSENYKCRAWVNFEGRGTVTIRASGGVASITDNGTGNYTVNFSLDMVDTNYATVCSVSSPDVSWPRIIGAATSINPTYSVSAVSLYVIRPDNYNADDNGRVQVAIFR